VDKSFYEQMLLKNYRGTSGAEENWNARAKHFNMSQLKDRSGFAERVTEILRERGILAGASILDIGGGSGRYAVPFAAHALHVTVTDISANMLELAKSNAESQGLDNLSYVKTEWESVEISALNWNKKFDLAFASMCPAVRLPEGFRKMMEVSKGFCLMNQFISGTDTLADYLIKTLAIKRSYDPHNDRDTVQAVFNLLWLEGYEPEITYLWQDEEVSYTVDEAFERYAGRYEQMARSQGLELKDLIVNCATQDVVRIKSESTLAMILWKV
jgi:SAM-dependent methyltransferase